MLVLFETPAGFALFKVLNEGKLSKVEDLWKEFSTSDSARQVVKLKAFSKFENTSEALSAATLLIDSKPSKGLRKFLRAHCEGETLAVADSKLGNAIKEKLQIECVHNTAVMELMRGVRSQLTELISGLAVQDLAPMSLGLSHSLSRYKLKFSPDKVNTNISKESYHYAQKKKRKKKERRNGYTLSKPMLVLVINFKAVGVILHFADFLSAFSECYVYCYWYRMFLL